MTSSWHDVTVDPVKVPAKKAVRCAYVKTAFTAATSQVLDSVNPGRTR